MVFVSHASPEDNELALWLSLQLANEGYAVWCDLTKLLGGEKFWEDIQEAIRLRTVKFIYILSRASNEKRGTLDELDCAIGTEKRTQARDFIITAKTDDLPFDEVYISVRRLNHIDFTGPWARGLARLLEKLEKDNVPKSATFNPDAVCSWWRDQFSADAGVVERPEKVLSNWFKVENIPSIIYEHTLTPIRPGPVGFDETTFPYPAVWLSDISFVTFARAEAFSRSLGTNLAITTKEHAYDDFLAGCVIKGGPKYLSQLLRIAWEEALKKRLPAYEMANKQLCFYFPGDLVKDDSIHFINMDGEKTWRGVVGYKTLLGDRVRHWHYGISGKPIMRPETIFILKAHVLFSDDRKTLWDNKDAAARARRNQCKNWWNDDWRDRMLAAMSHLAGNEEAVTFPLGSDVAFTLPRFPVLFESPVSYDEPKKLEKPDIDDYSFEDEDTEEEVAPADEDASEGED